jgi:hypothetical protein
MHPSILPHCWYYKVKFRNVFRQKRLDYYHIPCDCALDCDFLSSRLPQ